MSYEVHIEDIVVSKIDSKIFLSYIIRFNIAIDYALLIIGQLQEITE